MQPLPPVPCFYPSLRHFRPLHVYFRASRALLRAPRNVTSRRPGLTSADGGAEALGAGAVSRGAAGGIGRGSVGSGGGGRRAETRRDPGPPRADSGAAGGATAAQRAAVPGPAGSGHHRGERGKAPGAVAEVRAASGKSFPATSCGFRHYFSAHFRCMFPHFRRYGGGPAVVVGSVLELPFPGGDRAARRRGVDLPAPAGPHTERVDPRHGRRGADHLRHLCRCVGGRASWWTPLGNRFTAERPRSTAPGGTRRAGLGGRQAP
ncbi:collagen alpha-1(I) chain isoform X1 [Gallus gallus]|uniref:collagen alpha-1(I) chain isoform X1 n=1 Tax=Gallus gallus TaxID=9031 RepID=UPI001AE58AF7|nr:collagen alpha-1(I) chain isoform X1 [Gallus gallus]